MKFDSLNLKNFPDNIYVFLNETIRKKLIDSSKKKLLLNKNYELVVWLNKKLNTKFNGGDINNWLSGKKLDIRTNYVHPKYMSIKVIFELAKISNISLEDIGRNVISYRAGGRGKIIYHPKIPINITPEFESIMFHLFGDGHAGNFTPSYYQKNILTRRNFIKKLKNCFGDFNEKVHENKCQIRFPKAITDILSNFYNIHSYHSDKIDIPPKIFKTKHLNKLASIIAFIVDEGYIRDLITICSKNKKFLIQLKQLIESCEYKCNHVRYCRSSNAFYLTISVKSIEYFYKDYIELVKIFPSCNLAHKHADLIYIVSRKNNKTKIKNIDKLILNFLQNKKLTTKQLTRKLGYTNRAILYHLRRLYNLNKIDRIFQVKKFIWFVKSK